MKSNVLSFVATSSLWSIIQCDKKKKALHPLQPRLKLVPCFFLWLIAALSIAFSSATAQEVQYRLGVDGEFVQGSGYRVDSVGVDAGAKQMVALDDGLTYTIEAGDVITGVDGGRVSSMQGLASNLLGSKHRHGRVLLSVADKNAEGAERLFRVQLKKEPPAAEIRCVHYLGVFQTGTKKDGFNQLVGISHSDFEDMITHVGPHLVGSCRVLDGRQCTPNHIRAALASMPVDRNDTVMVYILAHGAHNEKGHFFQLSATDAEPKDPSRGKDMYRAEIEQILAKKNARLSVLLSESCNSFGKFEAAGAVPAVSKSFSTTGMTKLEDLLLNYRGKININAASKNQFGWAIYPYGGLFTYSFSTLVTGDDLPAKADWSSLINQSANSMGSLFQKKRKAAVQAGRTQSAIAQQERLTPQVFEFSVQPDRWNVDIGERTFEGVDPVDKR